MQEDIASQITAYYENKQKKQKAKQQKKKHMHNAHTHKKNPTTTKKAQSHKMMREKEFWGEKKNTSPPSVSQTNALL